MMHRHAAFFTVAIATFLLASPPARAAEDSLAQKLHFSGRWDLRKADRAITVNSGSSVLAMFDGAGIAAHFDPATNKAPLPTIAWQIDGGDWQEAEIAEKVELAAGLKAGKHQLRLVARGMDEHQPRWTPPLVASITFLGLDVAGGKLLEPLPEWSQPKLKIEILGDSITEGVVVHAAKEGKKTWPWRTDGRMAYPFQTAERLGAELRQVGFGAQGLTHGGSGGTPAAGQTFNFFYKDCPRDDWRPDLVVINQGTNDGGAKPEKFQPLYQQYLEMIRTAYPKAKIVALQPFNGAHTADIQAVVKMRREAGDTQVYTILTAGWLEKSDFTDGLHPNEHGSTKAAEHLADALKTLLPKER